MITSSNNREYVSFFIQKKMEKIKTAVLGYGRSGGSLHAGPIEKLEQFEMAAVCDIDPQRRRLASERFGCPVYENYHEMLEKEKLDLVCIVTRSNQHCEMTCDCLKAGVNVLVTKPWAANGAEAGRMVAAEKESGKKLLPWLPARWGSDLKRLKELKSENAVGNIFLIRRAVSTFSTRCDWQTEKRFAGGYLLNWGPHIVEPPILLAGGKVKSVFGQLRQIINPGDTEDVFIALITMDNGIIVQAEFTISVKEMPSWTIQGDMGTITVKDRNLTMVTNVPARPDDPKRMSKAAAEDNKTTVETLGPDLYGDAHVIYGEIAAALRGEREFPVTSGDALELSRILDAIRTSHTENRVVNL